MSKSAHAPSWLKFLKPKVDFFKLLIEQAQTTHRGILGLADWLSAGASGECRAVHDLEHQADDQKRNVEKQLHDYFVTPFDRQEVYDISARLDLIINGAKKLVKTMEFFNEGNAPAVDQPLVEMAKVLTEGTENLVAAIEALKNDLKKCSQAANESRKTETRLAAVYRPAMKELYENADAKDFVWKKHLYDQMTEISERIEQLGEKLLHLSVKLG